MELSQQQIAGFREELADFYARNARDTLPWRQPAADGTFDPYKIMVSELMLQQTQVARVIPKYHEFLAQFPDAQSLSKAELGDVLIAWQGLGYNRRAKFLWQAARIVYEQNQFPKDQSELVKLPGIGVNTAGAIQAYAYNQPVVFIETNVRTVYIHHFLSDQQDIADEQIYELVGQTLDHENSREFYWALMDYGSYLKSTIGNVNKASKHYAKQSKFHGSKRQVRGQIIRLLGSGPQPLAVLHREITDERLGVVLSELVGEQLIRQNGSVYRL